MTTELKNIINLTKEVLEGTYPVTNIKELQKKLTIDNAHVADQCQVIYEKETGTIIIYDQANDNELNNYSPWDLEDLLDRNDVI